MADIEKKQGQNSGQEENAKVSSDDAQQSEGKNRQGNGLALWLPIGMCLGCSYGLLFDNLAMGMSLGMLWGVAIGLITDSNRKKKQEGGNEEKEVQEAEHEKVTNPNELQETAESEQDNNNK